MSEECKRFCGCCNFAEGMLLDDIKLEKEYFIGTYSFSSITAILKECQEKGIMSQNCEAKLYICKKCIRELNKAIEESEIKQ